MRLLLDTCCFIWLASRPDLLSDAVRRQLSQPGAELYLSDCSAWEICLKWQAGKLRLPSPPEPWIEEQRQTWQLRSLPLERHQIYRSGDLPAHHRDPFDRLLVAQAMDKALTIASPDSILERYPVRVLW